MRKIQYALIIAIVLIFFGTIIIHAQNDCDSTTSAVIQVVKNICNSLGDNQVCYGNYEVGADLIDNTNLPNFTFNRPGDLAQLENIESLYLSALDPQKDTWGIAQMLLLAATSKGTQKLNLLLFGDVEVTNAVEPTLTVEVQVGIYSANIRNLPSVGSLILQSVQAGTLLEAVGRLEDNSWIRVRTDNGAIGWISADLIKPVNANEHIETLSIQDSASPYYGPMQAFYFKQGSGSACDNVTADGLIIQTPQGPASVSVSINGVNIDLMPGRTGATAYVQSTNTNMTITMLGGNSYVEANGTKYAVGAGEQSTIPIGSDNLASAEPSFPSTYNPNTINNLPDLPYIIPVTIPPTDNTTSISDIPLAEATAEATATTTVGTSGEVVVSTNNTNGTNTTNTSPTNEPSACELNTNSGKACGSTGDANNSSKNK